MKMLKKNTISSVIAVILISSIALTLFALPLANAQATNKTYPFIDAIPNPVGVGQTVLLNYGALNFLNAENDGWNVSVIITAPNGEVTTLNNLKTWSTGTAGWTFVPDQVGTYFLETVFPQQVYRNVTYLASRTEKVPLVVTQEASPSYPWQPLPEEYWTRPADSQLRMWNTIMGSWLMKPDNLYAPYNDGPESPHVLWSTPVGDMMGGVAGGEVWEHSYEDGDAYEGKFSGSVIIGGVLYYNKYISGNPQQTIVAIDLHTGKQLWEKTIMNNLRISLGQTIYWDSRNNRAAFSYLWVTSGTNWYALDALTGNLQFNMTNVPSGTNYFGPIGEILKYSTVNYGNATHPDWHLLQWNSTYVVSKGKLGMQESWGSQVLGVSYNATDRGYDMNISIPAGPSTTVSQRLPGSIQKVFVGDKMIGARVTLTEVNLWAIGLSPTNKGTLLYNTTWRAPSEWVEGNLTIGGIGQAGWVAWSRDDQVGVFFTKENLVHYAFNLQNGQFMYETEPQIFIDAWSDTVSATFGPDRVIAYGKLISATVGGTIYAYDVKTGERVWTFNATDYYHESYLGNNWWACPLFVTDGKIYIGHIEHSAQNPKPRGAPFYALNVTDGSLVFRADGMLRQTRWGGRAIIGDSIIAGMDTYDQQVYAIGKGPSSTTVTAPDIAVPFATPVVVKGTVMDVSPGTQSDSSQLRFPNGVPAMSDESMNDWMLYVYKQFKRPTDVTGVPVSIDAVDPNNNFVHIGDTTTDDTGTFSLVFTPKEDGNYTIYATFAGSKSYYASFARNALTVLEKPAEVVEPPQPTSIVEQYFVPAVAGIIVAIIAIGVLLAVLVLRKRQ